MDNIILRTNAIPVYGFLSYINAALPEGETLQKRSILDCGAGGRVPPVALFYQHGLEAWGIDNADTQLERARAFCEARDLQVHLRKGDMRHIPFEDETFDYVYEHYAMCHLNKQETAQAIWEMYRVLKKGGLCFLGVISLDSWPKSDFGEERNPGEFWMEEHEGVMTAHSMFSDTEADHLVSTWEIVTREKRVLFMPEAAEAITPDKWMALYHEAPEGTTEQAWQALYADRANMPQYTHLYYILKKPED